jgi:hypothetical protein
LGLTQVIVSCSTLNVLIKALPCLDKSNGF